MASDLAQLLAKVGEQAPDAQRRAAELFAVVERALAHAPEAERESALSSLRELRDSKTTWAGRAQQLQVGYEELSMSINPSLKIAAGVHGAPTALAAAESQAESTSFGPSMCNMLIVEDSSFQAMTMLSLAEESGYNAQVVASAEEALEVLEHNEEINLVLTDVMMDGTDGYQLLRHIRSTMRAHIAVVMLSAHESSGLVEQCVAHGADVFLFKPMRILELKNLWRYVWRRRHLQVLVRHVPAELLTDKQQAGKHDDAGTGQLLLRADKAQRETMAGLDGFTTESEQTVAQIEAQVFAKAAADLDKLALQDPVQSDVHSTSGETELALPHGTLAPNSAFAVCKVCDQQVPKAEIMAHVVQCSALASCHERLREVDSGLKRTVVVLGARHTQLQMAVDDLRSQIGTLRKLQQLLSDVASIRVIGGKASPSSAAKHIEQLLERHEHALIEDAAKWSKRSPAIMALWEKVRRLPRSKLSVCWDVLTVDDPAGKGGAKTSATGVAHKVSMKDFDIVDVLGSGGYGTVYLARRRSTKDLVAIKALTKAHLRETNALANVQLERLILSSAQSPSVVQLFFSFASKANVYMVMEYMPRGDCHALLEQLGFFEEDLASFYLAETIEGLAYLHSQGVIMRDLKPQNMLVGKDGHIKLTDFGLSAAYHGNSVDGTHAQTAPAAIPGLADRTGTSDVGVDGGAKMVSGWFGGGQCVGTPNYLAPEVLIHKRVTYALDLWSLGVVAYEFLVGEPPFDDETPEDIFENVVSRKLNMAIVNSLSKAASSLVRQLLTWEDSQRMDIHGAKRHAFFAHIDWERLRETEPSIKPAQRHTDDVESRWAGADLEQGDEADEEEEEDEGFDSTFESTNVRKLALMHLTPGEANA